ncbi:hypothetical protein Aph01nite_17410 [Acrocarpospora phusangensis]|uniref:Uncharacterized protein n=1 Tax=Acrocarpospora phusangensis TaxID=1070424 RepID=A0A919UJ51_9ACTN|nr:hypothetical protein [Acrocarpospora phusangensis]GIH23431.1 hypothetical protein Aph01nite_17410 [Acrocarpospora phusangensis]
MTRDVDRLVTEIAGPADEELGMTPGALDLLEEITAVPVPERRRVRSKVLLPLAVGVAVTLGVSLLPGTAAALDVVRDGGYYVITVKDLFADPERYQEQLRALGLNIRLEVKPATPAQEGTMLPIHFGDSADEIRTIEGPGDCLGRGSCAIGLKVPIGYRESVTIVLARKALPGEKYKVLAPINAAGQPLHCVPFVGKTVDEVRALLAARGVNTVTFARPDRTQKPTPGSWYVHDGVMSAAGQALLLVSPTPQRPDVPGPAFTLDPCS